MSWGEGGLLPQDVLVGGGQVFLGGQHLRGELAGTQATGAAEGLAARTPDVAQNGEAGEPDWGVLRGGEGGRRGRRGRSGGGQGGLGGGEGGGEAWLAAQEGTNLSVNIKLSMAVTRGRGRGRGGGGSWLGCKTVRGVVDGSGGVVDGSRGVVDGDRMMDGVEGGPPLWTDEGEQLVFSKEETRRQTQIKHNRKKTQKKRTALGYLRWAVGLGRGRHRRAPSIRRTVRGSSGWPGAHWGPGEDGAQ